MQIAINNNRVLDLTKKKGAGVTVQTFSKTSIPCGEVLNLEGSWVLPEGDIVMLLNYYAETKRSNTYCPYINPKGIRKAKGGILTSKFASEKARFYREKA